MGFITVAFECITFVDDGKTMVTKAIRIKNDMEGQGLTRMMKEFIYRDNQHNTDIQRLAYSFGKAELLKRVAEGKAELLLKQERLYFQASLQSLQINDLTPTERNCSVRKLRKTDMKDIFHSKLKTENLFPDGRIIVNWTPYRLLESNIDIFCDGSTLILGSNNEMQLHSTELMTIGFGYSAQVGVVYNLEIFGLLTENNFSSSYE
ncbi:uncharacterized protein LOC117322329 isoform X2 [Pecten maximus]|uniref:uncharacterized protein LOC117322329 isoform X2 n=1 Tax=Pecten maximus TaxID=6579 RepID=UPI001458E95F|nr:uncharacterized protein LOC117322329 isoform X2 [Pecten maximus]XP_033733080.1 uncharacterized protein LOC117322329 isoform X2 [Pecten maximus]XP_033733081.1 uncharacterized protein LOC117322329 isoform X2 [Pecten maximus]